MNKNKSAFFGSESHQVECFVLLPLNIKHKWSICAEKAITHLNNIFECVRKTDPISASFAISFNEFRLPV